MAAAARHAIQHRNAHAGGALSRVDVLQLALAQDVPITEKMIETATAHGAWLVVVWACRSGVTFQVEHVRQHLCALRFDEPELKTELLSLVNGAKEAAPVSASNAQKRRKSNALRF